MDLVHGVDVSVYQPRVDWLTLKSQGFKFAFIRATSGTNYLDEKFDAHWTGARSAGILRGAYHYLIANQDAKQQAQSFIARLGSDRGELPPVVDVEDSQNENVPNDKIILACKVVLDLIEAAFERKPMIYSRKTYLDAHFTQMGKFPVWVKEYDLWIAQYPYSFNASTMPTVNMPERPLGWKDWKVWQYSQASTVNGVVDANGQPTPIDLNWFRGTEAELYQFASVASSAEQTYTVQAGDTFDSIAARFSLTVSELTGANPSALPVGTILNIPARFKPVPPSGTVTPIPAPPPPPSSGGDTGGDAGSKPVVTYTVKSGDTLIVIAAKYRTTVTKIMEANPQITNRNVIRVGQVIVIPS